MADFKVGDTVRLKKDGALAVVTHAVSREGRKQERVEARRRDNGSVYSYWFDEVELVSRKPAPKAQDPEAHGKAPAPDAGTEQAVPDTPVRPAPKAAAKPAAKAKGNAQRPGKPKAG